MVREENYDVVIVGCGVGGLYTALNLPSEDRILMICKEDIESCDSMLAQGGICVLRDETDYDAYFEDTMRAGHYENRKESVDIMIRSSRDVINNLLKLGVGFDKNPDAPSAAPNFPIVNPAAACSKMESNIVVWFYWFFIWFY